MADNTVAALKKVQSLLDTAQAVIAQHTPGRRAKPVTTRDWAIWHDGYKAGRNAQASRSTQ